MQEISTLFPFYRKLIESLNPFPLPDPKPTSSFLGWRGKRKEGVGSPGPRQHPRTLHLHNWPYRFTWEGQKMARYEDVGFRYLRRFGHRFSTNSGGITNQVFTLQSKPSWFQELSGLQI